MMSKDTQLEYLKQKLIQAGFSPSSEQINQFYRFYEMLAEKNKVMNLTAITEYEEVVEKHFLDSLMFHPESESASLIDVGTGAGFPGIPLKIMYPELKITLMDSLAKRLKFLDEVIDELELTDISTIHGRAEDLGRKAEYREQYDYAVSRAVANLSTLSEYVLPFVKPNGFFVSYKGNEFQTELDDAEYALKLLSSSVDHVEKCEIPGSELEHTLLFIRKTGALSKKYPRKAGVPSKEPLRKTR